MDGLEHKDERLLAAQDADWRDKLARLRGDLPAEDTDGASEDSRGGDGE